MSKYITISTLTLILICSKFIFAEDSHLRVPNFSQSQRSKNEDVQALQYGDKGTVAIQSDNSIEDLDYIYPLSEEVVSTPLAVQNFYFLYTISSNNILGSPSSLSMFFGRTHPKYDAIQQICEKRRDDNEIIRILSAGCGMGNEAYGTAIALLAMGIDPERIEIIGIDIDHTALSSAAGGIYMGTVPSFGLNNRNRRQYIIDTELDIGIPIQEVSIMKDTVRSCVKFIRIDVSQWNDIRKLDRPFDLIFLSSVLEYTNRGIAPVENLILLLKQGGILYMEFFRPAYIKDATEVALTKGMEPVEFSGKSKRVAEKTNSLLFQKTINTTQNMIRECAGSRIYL